MKKMNKLGICLIATATMTLALLFGFNTTFEAQAAKTCTYARCHVHTGDCLPGNKVSARPRCTYTACIYAIGCGDPIID
jgi:hypothetical protein